MNSGEKIHGVPNFQYILAQHEKFIVDLTSMVRTTLDRNFVLVLYLKMHSTTINLVVPSMLRIKLGQRPSQSQLISFPPLLLILCFRIRDTSDSEKFVKIKSLLCKSSLTKLSSKWDEFFLIAILASTFLELEFRKVRFYLKLDFSQSGVTKYTT